MGGGGHETRKAREMEEGKRTTAGVKIFTDGALGLLSRARELDRLLSGRPSVGAADGQRGVTGFGKRW